MIRQAVLSNKVVAKYRKSTFVRSVTVSIAATLTDYFVSSFLHHGMAVSEVAATTIGSANGAIVSFYLNRWWAFKSKEGKLSSQAIRYLITLGVSIFLNAFGVYLLTNYTDLPFLAMRVIVTLLVGVLVNYQMYKHFVFKVK